MPADRVFSDIGAFAEALRELRAQRDGEVASGRKERVRRTKLTKAERREVLGKTDGRCHICGGDIGTSDWQADHILAHAAGGKHSVDNYLAAHAICNNYRWNYGAKEFQWILKLGVWMRTQIENGTPVGQTAGQKFCKHESGRSLRGKRVAAAQR